VVADLIRALLAAVAGTVLPGYFWAAVLRPTSGLGERLAYSTVVSMASVPTVAVILARVARTGIELWVALAAVLIVFGTGLLTFRLKGPAPGSAAPVLRMPEPTRNPWVLGLVAGALLIGLVLMASRRPPAALLALVAVALLAGGALMAWPRPAAPENPPPASPPEPGAFLSAPPPGPAGPPPRRPGHGGARHPGAPRSPASGSSASGSSAIPSSAAGLGTGPSGPRLPRRTPAGPTPAARPFGLPLSVVRDGGLAAILVLTACRVYSGGPVRWSYVSGGDQFSHAVMAEQMLAHGQYPGYLIYLARVLRAHRVICRFVTHAAGAVPGAGPHAARGDRAWARTLATRLWGWGTGSARRHCPGWS
jgi:hypothetical protein